MIQHESPPDPELIKAQAGKLLGHAAGYVGFQTVVMGLRHGLFREMANHPGGLSAGALAGATGLNPFYVEVWCRSAFGAEVLESDGPDTYRLAPHIATLLLDDDSPAFMGGSFDVLSQPEFFDRFSENLPTGQGMWWSDTSPAFIESVSKTGRAFYSRLIPGGFDRVPGLVDKLSSKSKVLELACGVGFGLVRLGRTYPDVALVGVDGDEFSIARARDHIAQADLADRIELVESPLEDLERSDEFDVCLINISMHECRDIEKVTANVHQALKPDGLFVISDFPFPESAEGLRSPAGRFMLGIQFFEAQIGDQLLPTSDFVDLLRRHKFEGVDSFDITPVHAVTYGRR